MSLIEQRQFAAAIFAGAAEIVREINADAAARAAARALQPSPPVEVAKPPISEELPPEPGCRCHIVTHPPCSWCEDGNWSEEDEPA